MKSCLYEGSVYHSRLKPKKHSFRYKVFMLYAYLDELPQLFDDIWFCSYNKRNCFSLWDCNHIDNSAVAIKDKIQSLVNDMQCEQNIADIALLTPLKHFGYYFSPLSVFYLLDAQQQTQGLIMEVSNTPWGEKHCYILDNNSRVECEHEMKYSQAKQLHVSPFMPMSMQHEFVIKNPDDELHIAINDKQDDELVFHAGLHMNRIPFTKANLSRCLLRYPFHSHKVIAAIYWQALRLFIKRVPFHTHPGKD